MSAAEISAECERSYERFQDIVLVGIPPFVEFNPFEAACAARLGEDRTEWRETWGVTLVKVENLGTVYTADFSHPVWGIPKPEQAQDREEPK